MVAITLKPWSGLGRYPRVLTIAGTDPTGGAGLHADLRTFAALKAYGMGVVTSIVAQNTTGVRTFELVSPELIQAQLQAVSDDVQIDAVKIGMLGGVDQIRAVSDWVKNSGVRPVVVDPVMVATSGDLLFDGEVVADLIEFCRLADLITPNLGELGVMVGAQRATTWEQAQEQAIALVKELDTAVLLKGGHFASADSRDALVVPGVLDFAGKPSEPRVVSQLLSSRVETKNTHGTGCSLSAALAALYPRYGEWAEVFPIAKAWLWQAINEADGLQVGAGNGPIDHLAMDVSLPE